MTHPETKSQLKELALGDHLERYLDCRGPEWFLHHGIITEIKNYSLDDIMVIHFHGKDSSDAVVKKSTLGQFLSERKVFWRRNYTCHDVLPVKDTLAILECAIGLRYYDLFTNNCEHLCLTAKLGDNAYKYQDQVNFWKSMMIAGAFLYMLFFKNSGPLYALRPLIESTKDKEIAWGYTKFTVTFSSYTLDDGSSS